MLELEFTVLMVAHDQTYVEVALGISAECIYLFFDDDLAFL